MSDCLSSLGRSVGLYLVAVCSRQRNTVGVRYDAYCNVLRCSLEFIRVTPPTQFCSRITRQASGVRRHIGLLEDCSALADAIDPIFQLLLD